MSAGRERDRQTEIQRETEILRETDRHREKEKGRERGEAVLVNRKGRIPDSR